jgi:hypothetical protein
MGWRLVEEVLDHCPDLKYREFRILVALAASARDETRQGWPGFAKLALQGNCSMSTVKRAMATLQHDKIIKQVVRQAPGRRGIYEILPLTGTTMVTPEQGSNLHQQGPA